MKKKYVLIVAGGSGTRMQAKMPKQFMELEGEPVIMRSIRAFYLYDSSVNIILALPSANMETWKQLCEEYNFEINHSVIAGGKTRYHSVKNALQEVKEESLVAVHDGVRPLVSEDTLINCFSKAADKGNAVPCVDLNDSIRQLNSEGNKALVRSDYRLIQTPQVFDSEIIKLAYKQEYSEEFTDDASLVEKLGFKINLVEGNPENIKITRKIDLLFASAIINKNK